MDLSEYRAALAADAATRELVGREIDRQRPKARYATVVTIDRGTRSCMVRFVGDPPDSDPVRVSYTSTAPASEGQEVRVEGTASDRSITAVRGRSDVEARVLNLEDEIRIRGIAIASQRMSLNAPIGTSSVILPLTNSVYDPIGFTVDSGGRLTVPVSGYYRIFSTVGFLGRNSTTTDVLAAVVHAPNGNVPYDIAYDTFYLSQGGTDDYVAIGRFVLKPTLGELWYLNAGDMVYLRAEDRRGNSLAYMDSTRLTIELAYAMPKYVKPVE